MLKLKRWWRGLTDMVFCRNWLWRYDENDEPEWPKDTRTVPGHHPRMGAAQLDAQFMLDRIKELEEEIRRLREENERLKEIEHHEVNVSKLIDENAKFRRAAKIAVNEQLLNFFRKYIGFILFGTSIALFSVQYDHLPHPDTAQFILAMLSLGFGSALLAWEKKA